MSQKASSCNKCGKSSTRSTGLKKHRRTCSGAPATVVPTVADPVAKKHRTGHGVALERLQFKLQKTHEELEVNVDTVDTKR